MAEISRKTRNRFKEHNLKGTDSGKVATRPWINSGRPSKLFECSGHCDWLGWIPVEEVALLEAEKG